MDKFNEVKYKNDFAKEKYDRIIVNVPKGQKENIDLYRKNKGYSSLNNYINELIRKDMNESKNNINVGNIEQKGDNNSISIG